MPIASLGSSLVVATPSGTVKSDDSVGRSPKTSFLQPVTVRLIPQHIVNVQVVTSKLMHILTALINIEKTTDTGSSDVITVNMLKVQLGTESGMLDSSLADDTQITIELLIELFSRLNVNSEFLQQFVRVLFTEDGLSIYIKVTAANSTSTSLVWSVFMHVMCSPKTTILDVIQLVRCLTEIQLSASLQVVRSELLELLTDSYARFVRKNCYVKTVLRVDQVFAAISELVQQSGEQAHLKPWIRICCEVITFEELDKPADLLLMMGILSLNLGMLTKYSEKNLDVLWLLQKLMQYFDQQFAIVIERKPGTIEGNIEEFLSYAATMYSVLHQMLETLSRRIEGLKTILITYGASCDLKLLVAVWVKIVWHGDLPGLIEQVMPKILTCCHIMCTSLNHLLKIRDRLTEKLFYALTPNMVQQILQTMLLPKSNMTSEDNTLYNMMRVLVPLLQTYSSTTDHIMPKEQLDRLLAEVTKNRKFFSGTTNEQPNDPMLLLQQLQLIMFRFPRFVATILVQQTKTNVAQNQQSVTERVTNATLNSGVMLLKLFQHCDVTDPQIFYVFEQMMKIIHSNFCDDYGKLPPAVVWWGITKTEESVVFTGNIDGEELIRATLTKRDLTLDSMNIAS